MTDRTKGPPALPDPSESPTISVEEAGRALGLGRAKAYLEAQLFERTGGAEGIPVMRFGRTLRCPTAAVRQLVGLS
jgi:hypothetical protein